MSDLPSVPVLTQSVAPGDMAGTDFEVTGVLGEGGMGRVLLARQKSLQRDVALKVLKAAETSRDVVDTLLAEAIITGSIEHPSIVPVHALGRDKEGLPVLVMKRIDGVSWRSLFNDPAHPAWASLAIDEGDRLDAHLEILEAVCNAAHYAHTRGVVHRDIKPENVMIGGFGEVYLVDWGIAVRKADLEQQDDADMYGPPVGTLAYMAPEMAMGDLGRIDARTDVYLLGATLHFILTGKPRHEGDTTLEVLFSARDSEEVAYGPNVPAELASICNRAMHVDPDERYQSALELRQAITSFCRHRGSLALSEKAFSKLSEIPSAQDAAGPVHDRRMYQSMTECRFAFMQALDAWKGNQDARRGLDAVLERMIEYEMAQRDVESARALLAELSEARPDIEKRIDALVSEMEAAKVHEAKLRAMERDADLRIGARFQLAILTVLPVSAIVALGVMLQRGQHQATQKQLVLFPAVVLMLLVGAFFVLRARLTTAVSRKAFAMFALFPIATLLHRGFAIARGIDVASIVVTDLVIVAIVAAAFAITILPRVALVVGLFGAGAVVAYLFPAYATHIFTGSTLLSTAGLVVFWGRMVEQEKTM